MGKGRSRKKVSMTKAWNERIEAREIGGILWPVALEASGRRST